MILNHSAIRLFQRVMSAFSLIDGQRDSATHRGTRVEKRESPFVLVACAVDGRWRVFQQDFDRPQASFEKLHEACDYANELARTRTGSIVLIQKRRDAAAHPDVR